MALFEFSKGIIPRLKQRVYVNGQLDPTIRCDSVSIPCGMNAATASFYCPELLWETNLSSYRDAYVVVTVGTGSWMTTFTVFAGYIDADSSELGTDSNTVQFSAKSILAFIGKVYVGSSEHVPTKTYRLIDPTTGRPTRTTVSSILRDLYSKLPGSYKQRLQLGITTALSDSADVPEPEITFRAVSYQSATEQLLGYYGGVVPCQRISGSCIYLDMVRIGDPSNPAVSVRVASRGESVIDGANVARITRAVQSSDITTRFEAYGTPRRCAITLTNFDPDPVKRLVPNWDSRLEAFVLSDPKLSSSKTAGSVPGCEKVFREWRLPSVLNGCTKLKALPVSVAQADGTTREVPSQAFVWQKALVDDPNNEMGKVGIQVSDPVPEKSVRFEADKNLIIFNEAQVRPISQVMNTATSQIQMTWEAAPIEVSIGIEFPEHYAYAIADGAAQAGIRYDFASDGLTEMLPVDNMSFSQLTNVGYPVGGKTWSCRYYDDVKRQQVVASSPFVTSGNVQGVLDRIAREQLASSCKRHVSLTIEIPWFAPAYQVGKRLIVEGDAGDFGNEVFTITGVSYDFAGGGQSTQITCDNVKPRHRSSIKTKAPSSAASNSGGAGEFDGEDSFEGDGESQDSAFEADESSDSTSQESSSSSDDSSDEGEGDSSKSEGDGEDDESSDEADADEEGDE